MSVAAEGSIHTHTEALLGLCCGRGQHSPVSQMGAQCVEYVELLRRLQDQQLLQHLTGVGPPDKAAYVNMRESGHQVLAVEAIHDAAVARDGVGKVFNFEGSFKAAGKESTKRSNEGAERGQGNAVDLVRVQVHRFPS